MSTWLNALMGGPLEDDGSSTEAAVVRICDRLMHSTLPEDRRAALCSLHALVKDHRQTVGDHGLEALISLLHRGDIYEPETARNTLEVLVNIMKNDLKKDELNLSAKYAKTFLLIPQNVSPTAQALSECEASTPSNVAIILDLLADSDFLIRYQCLQLITCLHLELPDSLMSALLTCPSGVSSIVSVLNDERDAILAECLSLIETLTFRHLEFRKLLVFENVFDILLTIIETRSEPVIVYDSCRVIINILKQTSATLGLFLQDTSNVTRLTDGLERCLPPDSENDSQTDSNSSSENNKPSSSLHVVHWGREQKLVCVIILNIIQALVSPGGGSNASNAQSMCCAAGVMPLLLELGLASFVPVEIQVSALYTLADLVRGHSTNQQELSSSLIYLPYGDVKCTQSSLLRLIKTAIIGPPDFSLRTETSPSDKLSLRKAALYVIQCFMYRNEAGKNYIAATALNPPPDDFDSLSVENQNPMLVNPLSGSTILLPLLDLRVHDSQKTWFAAQILSMVVFKLESIKEDMSSMYTQRTRQGSYFGNGESRVRAAAERSMPTNISSNNSGFNSDPDEPGFSKDDDSDEEESMSLLHAIVHTLVFTKRRGLTDENLQLSLLTVILCWVYESPSSVDSLLDDDPSFVLHLVEIINSYECGLYVQGVASLVLGSLYIFRRLNKESNDTHLRRNQRKMPPGEIFNIIESRLGFEKVESKIFSLREDRNFINSNNSEFFTDFLVIYITEITNCVLREIRLSPTEREKQKTLGTKDEMIYNENLRLRERISELQDTLRIQKTSFDSEKDQSKTAIQELKARQSELNSVIENYKLATKEILKITEKQDRQIKELSDKLRQGGAVIKISSISSIVESKLCSCAPIEVLSVEHAPRNPLSPQKQVANSVITPAPASVSTEAAINRLDSSFIKTQRIAIATRQAEASATEIKRPEPKAMTSMIMDI